MTSKISNVIKVPESFSLNVSVKGDIKALKYQSMIILKKFGCLELCSINLASNSCVTLAELLVRKGYAVLKKITSNSSAQNSRNSEENDKTNINFKIVLLKSSKFEELFASFK